jgi:hypothetical protein
LSIRGVNSSAVGFQKSPIQIKLILYLNRLLSPKDCKQGYIFIVDEPQKAEGILQYSFKCFSNYRST